MGAQEGMHKEGPAVTHWKAESCMQDRQTRKSVLVNSSQLTSLCHDSVSLFVCDEKERRGVVHICIHTDRYLHFDSHHPVHVKRGVVKCLFNRAEKVTTEVEDLEGEREHLKEVFGWNGYPKSFISNSTNRDSTQDQSSADEVRVVIPYVRGLSEDIRRVCRQFGIRTVFKSAPTFREKLTRVKDKLPMGKLSNVVYQVPCTCGKIYIGETVRRLDTRLKEHKDACIWTNQP